MSPSSLFPGLSEEDPFDGLIWTEGDPREGAVDECPDFGASLSSSSPQNEDSPPKQTELRGEQPSSFQYQSITEKVNTGPENQPQGSFINTNHFDSLSSSAPPSSFHSHHLQQGDQGVSHGGQPSSTTPFPQPHQPTSNQIHPSNITSGSPSIDSPHQPMHYNQNPPPSAFYQPQPNLTSSIFNPQPNHEHQNHHNPSAYPPHLIQYRQYNHSGTSAGKPDTILTYQERLTQLNTVSSHAKAEIIKIQRIGESLKYARETEKKLRLVAEHELQMAIESKRVSENWVQTAMSCLHNVASLLREKNGTIRDQSIGECIQMVESYCTIMTKSIEAHAALDRIVEGTPRVTQSHSENMLSIEGEEEEKK